MSTKKSYTATFKAQVVQRLLTEDQPLNHVAAEYGIHPRRLQEWKALVLEGLPSLFERQQAHAQRQAEHEQEREQLYAEIGKLTTQINWLKKKLGV
jgi:putative transposase